LIINKNREKDRDGFLQIIKNLIRLNAQKNKCVSFPNLETQVEPSLKPTANTPENQWLEDEISGFGGSAYFQGGYLNMLKQSLKEHPSKWRVDLKVPHDT